jgi:hypothetical protein
MEGCKVPRIIYKNKAGEKVPSFSTVANQWGIKTQPLIWWAYKRGEAGIPMYEKEEADVGTCAHDMVDCDSKGKKHDASIYPANIITQAQVCFDNWLTWKKNHKFESIESELSLVSEKYQYGGTLDNIAMVDSRLCLLDLKTGKEVYEDNIVQIAAYAHLWNENFPDTPIEGGCHIIRTGKEIAMFSHNWYGELPGAMDAFLHLRALYDLHKEIKKLK